MNTNMSNPNMKRESWQIAGDQPRTSAVSTVNAVDSALCNPIILYKGKNGMERFLTFDLFKVEGEPMHAIVYCPLCTERDPNNARNMSLRICETNKKIHLDHKAFPKFKGITTQELVKHLGLPSMDAARGVISIEPFGCTWEEEPGLRRGFGFSCCNWRVQIDNNVARDV